MSEEGRPYRKVLIVGFAPTSRDDAPFKDTSYEVWGLNDLYRLIPRADRWFEMHSKDIVDNHPYYPNHLAELQSSTIPVFMQEVRSDIPRSVRYPIEDMTRYFFGDSIPEGTPDSEVLYYGYFNNTISYMMAIAIHESCEHSPIDEIHLYGVDMAADSEYSHQRPSVEYFIGIARGRGIKVVISPKSDLLKTIYPYEYTDRNPLREKIRARIEGHNKEIENFINQRAQLIAEWKSKEEEFKSKMAQLDGTINGMRGMIQEAEYYLKIWSPYSTLNDGPQKSTVERNNSGRP